MTNYRSATAETHYADIDGARIAYRTVGSGSPLILANRMRATIDTWDPDLCLRLFKSNRDAGLIVFAGAVLESLARAA